jgi:hypothetical protein
LSLDPYTQVDREMKRMKIKKNKINLIELKSSIPRESWKEENRKDSGRKE